MHYCKGFSKTALRGIIKAMKIAIDIRTAGGEKAGKGWYTFHIVQNLLKIDHENEYILYAKDGIPGFEQFKNAKVKLVNGGGIFWHLNVAHDVKKEKVDIFFAPSSYIIPALLPKSIKTILVVHDLVAFLFPVTHEMKAVLIEKLFFRLALRKSAHICAVSENTKQDILQKFKYDEKKISVIYCAAGEEFQPTDKATLQPFINATNLPANFFLAVGTIEPRKNYLNLIRAFAEVSKDFPDWNLIIVGKKGWDYEEVFRQIRINYLQKKVHILGYLSSKSLVNLYSLARGLVFPSFYEGFGIPPLEAMQCGCPVIASNTSSIPEVVGDSALLINPEDPREITAAMKKLIKSDELYSHLRELGLKQAKKFSWETSAGKLLKVIKTEP